MSSQDEMVATFLSLTGGDSQEFARSFLESTGWNVEMAVGMMLDGGGRRRAAAAAAASLRCCRRTGTR